jgi:hypothetical protein
MVLLVLLSRAKNSGRQCHFKIWLDCHKLKIFPCLIMSTSTKCQKFNMVRFFIINCQCQNTEKDQILY